MNFQFYLEKLHNSEIFKNFIKENSKTYFCSGFIVIDKIGNENKIHVDYFDPSTKKMFSFNLESEVELIPIEEEKYEALIKKESVKKVFSEVKEIDFSFERIEEMILDEMKKNKVKNKLQKILISLQNVKGKNLLICTVFISNLGLIRVNINLDEEKIELFDKKSLFDMMKIMKK